MADWEGLKEQAIRGGKYPELVMKGVFKRNAGAEFL